MCDCIEKVNEQLRPYNTAIELATVIDFDTGKMSLKLEIPTVKIKSRGTKLRLSPLFCPFCGEDQQKDATNTTRAVAKKARTETQATVR